MKTILGTELTENIRGILYLCYLSNHQIEVKKELFFDNCTQALMAYANIPNPASQVVLGNSFEELCTNLEDLHEDMKNPDWIKELEECI